MFGKSASRVSVMRSLFVQPWGAPRVNEDAAADPQRVHWISNLQRFYGVDRQEAETVVDDVLRVMTFIHSARGSNVPGNRYG